MWNKLFLRERYSHIHLIMRKYKDNFKSLRKATSSCSESLGRKIYFLCEFGKSAMYPRLDSQSISGARGFWFRFST